MTDARLPERYLMDRRLGRLSDADFRGYMTALLWSVSNRTDGRIDSSDLPLIPHFKASPQRLVDGELWTEVEGGGWTISDFGLTQSSRSELEQLEQIRKADRDKKRRQRAAKSSESPPAFTDAEGESPGRSRGRVPGTGPGTSQAGKGQSEVTSGQSSGWPTRRPGEDQWEEPVPGVYAEPGAYPEAS